MKIQRKLLKTDARRCFLSWRFVAIIVAVCVICLMSMSELLKQIITEDMREQYSSGDQLNKMLLFERFKPLLIVVLAAVYSCSFAEDWKHRYFRFIYIRSNLKAYAFSKIVITVAGVVLATTLGFILFGIVLYPWIKMGVTPSDIPEVLAGRTSFSDYPEILTGSFPVLYFLLQGWIFGLSASCTALIGLWLTVYQPSIFLGIGGPFFVFYFFIMIGWLLPTHLSYLYVGIFRHLSILPQNIWIELGYHTLYLMALNAIAGIGFYRALRKRWKNGLL